MNELKRKLVERLKNDYEVMLNEKLPRVLDSIETKGDGTYRNLINSLGNMMKLIEEHDWQLRYSKYKTINDKGEEVCQVAVWEQNSDGEIKNHQFWNVEDDKNKQNNYYDIWKRNMERLNSEDGNEKRIIPTSAAIRGVGKTTFLLEQTIKHDGIYVSPNRQMNSYAMQIARDKFGVIPTSAHPTSKTDSMTRSKINSFNRDRKLFIDEGVDLDKIDLTNTDYVAFKYIKTEQN